MMFRRAVVVRTLRDLLLGIVLIPSWVGCQVGSQAQNMTGVSAFEQGNYPLALQRFNQAVSNDPHNADAYYNLASVYHRQARQSRRNEDFAQAEALYNQCLDNAPNHVDCHRALAVMLRDQSRVDDASRLLQRWALREPGLPAARVELARFAQEQGQRDIARQNLLDAIALNPYEPRALAALGQMYEQEGNPGQALANYQRSLSANSYQPELAQRVALLRGATPVPSLTPGYPDTRTVSAPQPAYPYQPPLR